MKCLMDSFKKKVTTMNIKMTTNSQLSTTESKKRKTKTNQAMRTETESQIWRTLGWWSVGMGVWGNGGKVKGLRSTNW